MSSAITVGDPDLTIDKMPCIIDQETGEITPIMPYEQRELELKANENERQARENADRKSPYSDFAQFNLEHVSDWIALNQRNHAAVNILLFLLRHADRHNALICSSQVLEEALGYSRTTVFRAINTLKSTGFIDVKKSGSSNVFLLNSEIAWKSWGTGYKYAEFNAKIVISDNEQDDEKANTKANVKATRMNVVTINERK